MTGSPLLRVSGAAVALPIGAGDRAEQLGSHPGSGLGQDVVS